MSVQRLFGSGAVALGMACALQVRAYDLAVRVESVHSLPIAGAYVWVDPDAPQWARTDAQGMARFSGLSATRYLVVARHPDYGRADAQYPLLPGGSNVTFVLPSRSTFRVATYNMKGYDGWSTSQREAQARLYWTVQPDITCVQEASDEAFGLDDFVDTYMPGYTCVVSSVGGPIHNAVMSFFPISRTFSAGSSVMIRDLYGIETSVAGLSMTFMSVHFKAGGNYSDGELRNDEATYVGQYCSNLYRQGTPFVLAGDMNDDPDYYREPSRVHPILAQAGAGLVELSPTDDDGNPATYSTFAQYDFIVPVTAVAARVTGAKVLRTQTMDTRPGWLAYNDSTTASDHMIVYADIEPLPEPLSFTVYGCVVLLIIRRKASWN